MGVSRTSRSLSQRQRNFANIYTHTGLARILKQGKINTKMAKIGKLPKIGKLLKIRKSSMLGGGGGGAWAGNDLDKRILYDTIFIRRIVLYRIISLQ